MRSALQFDQAFERAIERLLNENTNTIRQLEHRCSVKNISGLEQKMEVQQGTIRELHAELSDRNAHIEKLELALAAAAKPPSEQPHTLTLTLSVP